MNIRVSPEQPPEKPWVLSKLQSYNTSVKTQKLPSTGYIQLKSNLTSASLCSKSMSRLSLLSVSVPWCKESILSRRIDNLSTGCSSSLCSSSLISSSSESVRAVIYLNNKKKHREHVNKRKGTVSVWPLQSANWGPWCFQSPGQLVTIQLFSEAWINSLNVISFCKGDGLCPSNSIQKTFCTREVDFFRKIDIVS